MKVYPVVCFALVTIVVTQAQFGHAHRLGLSGLRGDPEMVGTPTEVGLPGPTNETGTPQMHYCNVSSKIMSFVRKFRFMMRHGATGGTNGTRIAKSVTMWAYDCLHVGLNVQENVFEIPTYQCCQTCEFPNFLRCFQNFSGFLRQSKCNSEALRCIASCINTKGTPDHPGRKRGRVHPSAQKRVVNCPMTQKRVGDSYCLERSCIPV